MGEAMASASDIARAITSALVEIGVTGEVDASIDEARSLTWAGSPSSDDLKVVVTVRPLTADDL